MSKQYPLHEGRDDGENHELHLAKCKTSDEALDAAIRAAEASMKTLKLAQTPSEKAKLSQRVKHLLYQAERIKSSDNWRSEVQLQFDVAGRPRNAHITKEPRSTRTPSKAEQIIILKAGFLNGFKFPPWTTTPAPKEFEIEDGEALFTDMPELPLSSFQENVLEGWMRPEHAMPPPSWFPDSSRSNHSAIMNSIQKIDLVQDAVTDCSVVASLCAGVARTERGGYANISGAMLYPYDNEANQPAISGNGKYIARLNFNGCFRRVVIDDRLPISKTNRVIHVVDRQNPGLLWPALVEKAYLKVRGGYDFPGSNSGTDLWILTGWIPEQTFLQADEFDPDRFWKRVLNAFDVGDVMITMGTGKMSDQTEKELGLAGEHDYAVLDMREVDGQCLMLVKNPWCEGISWRGRFAGVGKQGANVAQGGETDGYQEPFSSSRDLLNADEKLLPGSFWMDLDNIVQYFESIYLNWNPGLFGHRQDIHFKWDLSHADIGPSKPRGRFASLVAHPQFQVTASHGGTIWVLLWRHLRNVIPAAATEEEIQSDRYHIDVMGHITLIAFSTRGRRVLLPERPLEKGWFVDSPQTLLRLDDCDAGKPYTIVPMEQDLVPTDHTFTISTFSNSPLDLTQADARSPHTCTSSAAWTTDTAGGNAHSPLYSTNPQFTLTVPQHTRHITLLLESCSDDLNVHVKLVHSNHGRRVHTLQSKDIIADSKDYRRGCCLAEHAVLDPGAYTIICSTFEPHQLGAFALTVESSAPTQLVMLPKEGAGRVRVRPPKGIFRRHETSIACPITMHRLGKAYVVARSLDHARPAAERSLVRMSLSLGRGPTARILITSGGEYVDGANGFRLEDVDLGPGHGAVWLVLERMSVGMSAEAEESFGIELLVDQIDAIDCGDWVEWD